MPRKSPKSPKVPKTRHGKTVGNKQAAKELRKRLDTRFPETAAVTEGTSNGTVGRPPLVLDKRMLAGYAALQATYEQIAAVFGVDPNTITENAEYRAIVEKERQAGLMSLLRAQWRTALNGNATMQIWLGKLYLKQNPLDARPLGNDGDDDGDAMPMLVVERTVGEGMGVVMSRDPMVPTGAE